MKRYYQVIEHEGHILDFEVQEVLSNGTFSTVCYCENLNMAELLCLALDKLLKPKDRLKVE